MQVFYNVTIVTKGDFFIDELKRGVEKWSMWYVVCGNL